MACYGGAVPNDGAATKGERTRRAILDAAIERFGADGYRSTSVATVARAAGVGPTVPFAYFPNKPALFRAALDEDAAGLIAVAHTLLADLDDERHWRGALMPTLVVAVDDHPLARRVLSGLEPEATSRMLELPALANLRATASQRLRDGQATGLVRADLDPDSIGSGLVLIFISLLMSSLQFGVDGAAPHVDDVLAVFDAALEPPV